MVQRLIFAQTDPRRHAGADAPRKARKLMRLLRRPIYRRGLRRGVAAAVEHDSIPYMSGMRTVVDIGAHRGQFALFALERFPEASLVCVEPLPGPRAKLSEVTAGGGRVRILDVAASNRSESEAAMHVSSRDDSSSLQAIGELQISAFPGTEEVGRVTVTAARLDSLLSVEEIREPALLKVDVQGHEYEALEGCSGILGAFHQIAVEVSFVELYRGQRLAGDVTVLLENAGFSLTGVFDVKRTVAGECLQADLLFERHRSDQ